MNGSRTRGKNYQDTEISRDDTVTVISGVDADLDETLCKEERHGAVTKADFFHRGGSQTSQRCVYLTYPFLSILVGGRQVFSSSFLLL